MERRVRPLLPVLLVAGLVLTGCSSGGDSQSSIGGAAPAADRAQAPALAGDADGANASGGGGGGAVGEPLTVGDDPAALARGTVAGTAVVRTGDLSVRVDDLRAAADQAARLTRDAGGVVASERSEGSARGEGHAAAELVLRVPPERFDEVLGRLAALGEERGRGVSTTEVGDELVDLESRLATQRASVDRVRALLAEATDLGQVVQVEAELTRRTADLESLQARLAALQDSVQLSTISLRFDTERETAGDAGLPGFLDGLAGGWAALTAAASVLAATAGALLPFLPLLLLLALGVSRLRRRAGASAPAPAGPPAAAA